MLPFSTIGVKLWGTLPTVVSAVGVEAVPPGANENGNHPPGFSPTAVFPAVPARNSNVCQPLLGLPAVGLAPGPRYSTWLVRKGRLSLESLLCDKIGTGRDPPLLLASDADGITP